MDIPSSPLPPRLPDAKLWRAMAGDVVEALAPEGTGELAPPRRSAEAAAPVAPPEKQPQPTPRADSTSFKTAAPRAEPPSHSRTPAPRPTERPAAPPSRSIAVAPTRTDASGAPVRAPAQPELPAGDAPEPLPQPLRFAADAARASLAAGRPQPALALLDSAWPIATAPAELQALRAQGLLDLGRETEAAEVVARGLGIAPKSSALRWMGMQAAVRLEAPAHAAALALPLLRQAPPPREWETEVEAVVLPDEDAAAEPEPDAGVPMRARESLKALASVTVTMHHAAQATQASKTAQTAPEAPATPAGTPPLGQSEEAPAIQPALAHAEVDEATHSSADAVDDAAAEPHAADTVHGKPLARSMAAPMTAADGGAMEPDLAPADEPVVDDAKQRPDSTAASTRSASQHERVGTPAPVLNESRSLIARPAPDSVQQRTPPAAAASMPEADLPPRDGADPPAPSAAPRESVAPPPPPRTVLFEQRRAAVLSALESTLSPPDRRALVDGRAIQQVERWLAPTPEPMMPEVRPALPVIVTPGAPDDARHAGAELGLLRMSKEQFAIMPTAATQSPPIGQPGPEQSAAPAAPAPPMALAAEQSPVAPAAEGAVPRQDPAARPPVADSHIAPTATERPPAPDQLPDARAARIAPPPSDPTALFAWLAVDASVPAAGTLAAVWRVAAEQAILAQRPVAAAHWRTPMPVSWRGVLHAGLIGAALVSWAAGRNGTAAVLGAAAAVWWLRSGRRR